MPEEIEAIKAKHTRMLKAARKVFWDALEIGDWFLASQKRVSKWKHGAGWERWLRENFDDQISVTTVRNYIRLATHRTFLVAKLENQQQLAELDRIPSVRQALVWISEREEADGKSHKRAKVIDVEASQGSANNGTYKNAEEPPERAIRIPPPPEVQVEAEERGEELEDPEEEPLAVLRDRLKNYVIQQYMLQHLGAEIAERIRVAELSAEQVQQCIEWACREHEEVKVIMLQTFTTTAVD